MTKKKIKVKVFHDKRPKDMAAWQDCQWKRIPCEKDTCPICGRIKRDREKHIAKGEDPDTMKAALEDVGNAFKETMTLIRKDAKKQGWDLDNIDDVEIPEPPEPRDYPVYNELMAWRNGIFDITKESDDTSSAWLFTEAGQDLMWYANTILAKVYRQLSNIWEIENVEDEYKDLEYEYTGYVLGEVFALLESALDELSQDEGPHAKKFNLARLTLGGIKEKLERGS